MRVIVDNRLVIKNVWPHRSLFVEVRATGIAGTEIVGHFVFGTNRLEMVFSASALFVAFGAQL